VADQLARTAGHVTSVKRMIEGGRPCADVLIQLAAVRAAIDRASRLVLEDHVESCLRGAASNGMADDEWARLKEALDTFIR
jgi:DNA-binding FrmR family transcriptional regulator